MSRFRRGAAALLAAAVTAAVAVPGPARAAPPRAGQWYLDRIAVAPAQAVTRGAGVTVGMFLTSVNQAHPELGGRVRPGRYVGADGRIKSRPASLDLAAAREIDTALAGLVVAQGGTGLLGVAPEASVQPISAAVGADRLDAALRWLVDEGAGVIDLSGAHLSRAPRSGIDGVKYALAHDVVVVLDARAAHRLPPAASVGVVVVGGLDERDRRDGAAPFDGRVTLTAPGATLGLVGLAAEPVGGGAYPRIATGGDDQAAALVAGAAALVRSRHPDLPAAAVINRLVRTARDAGPAGVDSTYGYGVLDAGAAVTADVVAVTANPLGDPGPPAVSRWPWLIAGGVLVLVLVAVLAGAVFAVRRRRRGVTAGALAAGTPRDR